jgi:hypothetical protein
MTTAFPHRKATTTGRLLPNGGAMKNLISVVLMVVVWDID